MPSVIAGLGNGMNSPMDRNALELILLKWRFTLGKTWQPDMHLRWSQLLTN